MKSLFNIEISSETEGLGTQERTSSVNRDEKHDSILNHFASHAYKFHIFPHKNKFMNVSRY